MGFNVSQIKCADCVAFSPHIGFFLYLFTYCFHMIKPYLLCKGTTFPSLLIIFEWKSLAKPRIPPKMFYKSAFSRLQKPFVYSILPFVHVLSCENNHSSLHLLNTTQPPILFIILLFASLILDISMEFRYTCVVFMELCPIPSLITAMGMFMSLATLAQVWRAT